MLIAIKPMSIGPHKVERGDQITAELQSALPPGRVEALKAQRFVEEISDEQRIARAVGDVLARISKLEERIDGLERKLDGRTKTGRAVKAAQEVA